MPTDLFANNKTTTLASGISSGATSLTVASSTGFPAPVVGVSQFRVLIGSEILVVTAVSGTTWTVTRGAESTTATSHASGDAVTHVVTAATLNGMVTSVAGRTGAVTLSTADVAGSFTLGPLDLLPAQESGLPTEVARYDADSIVPQTDATAVASWPDDTGTTGALVQGTGANQPLLKLNQINGHSAVRFAGGSWWMSKARSLTSDFTIVVVGKPTNAISFPVAIGGYLTSYGSRICGPGAGTATSATAAYPGWAVYRITVTGGTAVVYRNGIPIDSRSASNMTTLYVGQDGSGTFFSDWDIAHIRVYSGIVVPEEATGIDMTLARRYGLRVGPGSPSIRSRTNATYLGQSVVLSLPETRVPGAPLPLVIFSHGGGGDQDAAYGYTGAPGASTDAALAAGFAVASSNLHGSAAGNAQQLQDNLDLLTWVQTQITVSKIVLLGQSLGGLPSLNAIQKNTFGPTGIPVVGALLIYPVVDTLAFYALDHAELIAAFSLVNGTTSSAYGSGVGTVNMSVSYAAGTKVVLDVGVNRETVTIASVSGAGPYVHILQSPTTKAHASGVITSDAGTKITDAGYNPMDAAASAYGNKRYRIYHSTGDSIVAIAPHTTAFIAKVAATARESSLVPTRGNHGDQSNFDGRDQAQFLLRCLNDPVIV